MDKQALARDFFRRVLADVLDDLRDQVPGYLDEIEEVKQSLRAISQVYRRGLSKPYYRSDWGEAANRCAYVFLYLMQHCNLVFSALQDNLSEISAGWRFKYNVKVCSIGGSPGSDLLGLATFLRLNKMLPSSLRCLVLDLYPEWKETWERIHGRIPGEFQVAYRKCDVVWDTAVSPEVRNFIQEADLVTFVKSFSAMAAFFRTAFQSQGNFLRSILRELKPGCLVLYIDNYNDGDNFFQTGFTSRVDGLEILHEFRGTKTVPSGAYPCTIGQYCRLLDFSPMRSCDVTIQLFRKRFPAIPSLLVTPQDQPLRFSSAKRPVARYPAAGLTASTGLPRLRRNVSTGPRVIPESRNLNAPHEYHAPMPRRDLTPFQCAVLIGILVVGYCFFMADMTQK